MWHTPAMRKHIAVACALTSVLLAASCKKDEAKEPEKTSETKKAPGTEKAPEAEKKKPAPAAHAHGEHAKPAPAKAMGGMAEAKIEAKSDSKVAGVVHFMAKGETVTVHAKITGLTPGEHGFHVHEKGDCSSPDGKSAGGHFNPHGVDHAGPDADAHHAGDLGNITANAEGVAELTVDLPTSFLSLAPDAKNNIVGRAVVVHGGADDLKSQPSGAAGPRVGCGVIAMPAPE